MKRQSQIYLNTRSKRQRLSSGIGDIVYTNATNLYNFMCKDPLCDWLKFNNQINIRNPNNSFTSFLFEKGYEFEKKVVAHINTNITPVTFVSATITDESLKKTREYINSGTPVLHSVPLRDSDSKTQGIADLVIRSDYLNLLTTEKSLKPEEIVVPNGINQNFHYVVVDIKFSTIPLRSNNIHILNQNSFPAYKAQCYIYTRALGILQGYTPSYAFILGRKTKYTSKCITNYTTSPFDKLGMMDYETFDKPIIELTHKAVKWYEDCRDNYKDWSLSPPTRVELYPNMCVDSGKWETYKKKLALDLKEITTIWNVGYKHRNNAHALGIYSWDNKKCTAKKMGINGKNATIIDSILKINRQTRDKIRPKEIISCNDWRIPKNEIYLDLETVSNIFNISDIVNQINEDQVFLIGVTYKEGNTLKHKSFVSDSLTKVGEYKIMSEFMEFYNNLGRPRIFHWVADEKIWEAAENRQFDAACGNHDIETKDLISDTWKVSEWYDLGNLFRSEPIVIKDCFKFGLKSVAEAMYKHGMINITNNSDCKNGLSAMIDAYKSYDKGIPRDSMDSIIAYNKYDCEVLYHILTYLRKNH